MIEQNGRIVVAVVRQMDPAKAHRLYQTLVNALSRSGAGRKILQPT